jgi:predicted GNAT superfamily acetyltransferase
MQLRDATSADFPQLIELNFESEHFLSPLSLVRLEKLHAEAAYHRVLESDQKIGAFLLAFREGCSYDSPNYRWFAATYDRFLYIDRVVVSGDQQGKGLGKLLYTDLFAFASRAGAIRVCCEFDVEPPNEPSRLFHQRFGFREVGTQRVAAGKKQVSLQVASLPSQTEIRGAI